ncbi:hypothetical protein NHH03_18765 [Stieleria sp. TO1_6]|uniref:hypothetical protein n=1 Tax=Stieleria tagensis TaxID=2956795 RepID=UPI00209ACC76|nr:hypothetical protein [Stieleria tagensis]MCO8123794.1 hypothetical protein [Stieleria tagensis]
MPNVNPYKPSADDSTLLVTLPQHGRNAWSITSAIISVVLGIASFALGVLVMLETIRIGRQQGYNIEIAYGLLTGSALMVIGAAWIIAGWLYWRQRNRIATAISVTVITVGVIGILLLMLA